MLDLAPAEQARGVIYARENVDRIERLAALVACSTGRSGQLAQLKSGVGVDSLQGQGWGVRGGRVSRE